MHCIVCDRNLKDNELVRRHAITNEFLDMCDGCLREIPNIPTRMPQGFFHVTDPFDDRPDDDTDTSDVTDCYNSDLDND
jgi:hypothetical protein